MACWYDIANPRRTSKEKLAFVEKLWDRGLINKGTYEAASKDLAQRIINEQLAIIIADATTEKQTCICPAKALFNYGCTCGYRRGFGVVSYFKIDSW